MPAWSYVIYDLLVYSPLRWKASDGASTLFRCDFLAGLSSAMADARSCQSLSPGGTGGSSKASLQSPCFVGAGGPAGATGAVMLRGTAQHHPPGACWGGGLHISLNAKGADMFVCIYI